MASEKVILNRVQKARDELNAALAAAHEINLETSISHTQQGSRTNGPPGYTPPPAQVFVVVRKEMLR